MNEKVETVGRFFQRNHTRFVLSVFAVAGILSLIVHGAYYARVLGQSFRLTGSALGGWQALVPILLLPIGLYAHWRGLSLWPSLEKHAGTPTGQLVEYVIYGVVSLVVAFAIVWSYEVFEAPVAIQQTASENHAQEAKKLADERDVQSRKIEILKAQMEQLTSENAALQKGAPILSGPAARLAEVRATLMKQADAAPSREEFTKERGKAWVAATSMLCAYIKIKSGDPNESRPTGVSWFESAYTDTYESLQEAVASLRGAAVSISEKDLAE